VNEGLSGYELNLADRTFGFGLVTLESDQLQDLDLRAVLGGGVGYPSAEYKATTFDAFSGLSFNQESFSNQADRNSGEILAGEELSCNISDRTSFTQRCISQLHQPWRISRQSRLLCSGQVQSLAGLAVESQQQSSH